jgi:gamma-glutamylputrescine oxidase
MAWRFRASRAASWPRRSLGQSERFDVLAELPIPPFPGGPGLRAPLLTLAMTWYALRDRLGV